MSWHGFAFHITGPSCHNIIMSTQIAKFMGPTWGPPGACRTQMGPCWPHEPCYQGIYLQGQEFDPTPADGIVRSGDLGSIAADDGPNDDMWRWHLVVLLENVHVDLVLLSRANRSRRKHQIFSEWKGRKQALPKWPQFCRRNFQINVATWKL